MGILLDKFVEFEKYGNGSIRVIAKAILDEQQQLRKLDPKNPLLGLVEIKEGNVHVVDYREFADTLASQRGVPRNASLYVSLGHYTELLFEAEGRCLQQPSQE